MEQAMSTHKILCVTKLDLRRGAETWKKTEGRKPTPATVVHKKLLQIQRQKVDYWVPGGGVLEEQWGDC